MVNGNMVDLQNVRIGTSITNTQKAILKAFDIDSKDVKARINDLSS